MVILTLVGDVMLDRNVSDKIKKYGYKYPFEKVVKFLKDSDITFANLESPISNRGRPDENKGIRFEASPEAEKSLKYSGIDIVSLANNHILDYGEEALLDTLKALKRIKIKRVGLNYKHKTWDGLNIKKFEVIKKKGVRFGFLSYSDILPSGFSPNSKRPGLLSMLFFKKAIRDDIYELKKQADVVIVALHMGREYRFNIQRYQAKHARDAINAGADIVVGHHPHVLEKIEKYKNGLIFYSLGNFVFDQDEQKHAGVSKSMIVKVMFDRGLIKNYKIIPVHIEKCQPMTFDWEISVTD